MAAPRVFGFDTGFVSYYRGWSELRSDDVGALLEHLFLNEVHAHGTSFGVHYWRDKAQHEVDFVLLRRGGAPLAVECKSSEKAFDPAGLASFRRRHPDGSNWLVVPDGDEITPLTIRGLDLDVVPLAKVAGALRRASSTIRKHQ